MSHQEDPGPKIPLEHMLELRRLTHDMSNALEIIVQTNYLLNMGEPDDTTKQWLKMMDTGVQQAAAISKEFRQYLMLHSQAPISGFKPAAGERELSSPSGLRSGSSHGMAVAAAR